jgi:hypothetical protein
MTFETRQKKPFYTELCVYQSVATDNKPAAVVEVDPDDGAIKLPDVVCSRIYRVYNAEGSYKQGCTSFYTLRRYGPEQEDQGQ